MLRTLLVSLLVGGTLSLNAQQANVQQLNTSNSITGINAPLNAAKHKTVSTSGAETSAMEAVIMPTGTPAKAGAAGEKIGETTYDLQTNYGMCRRITLGDDGEVRATWTRSLDFTDTAGDRGTGFNSTTEGVWGEIPDSRIESIRVGWPSVGTTESGREYVITHSGAEGMNFAWREPGGDWQDKIIEGDAGAVWARSANDGDNIHVVVSRSEGTASGVTGGLNYFRSSDAGDTWEGPFELPGLAELVPDVSADSYFIDVNGETVVIVLGQYANQVIMYKSTDGGDSFESTVVVETDNPLVLVELPLGPVAVSGGNMSAIVEDSGLVHLWWDLTYNTKDADADGASYFPNTSAIVYWNEDRAEPSVIGQTVRIDYDQDGTTALDFDAVETQSYGNALVGQISTGIDAENNLYLTWASQRDGAYESEGRQYRDVYLAKSMDGGATWIGPLNVSDDDEREDVYPAIARTVTDVVHMIWQSDDLTGTLLQNTNGQGHEAATVNDILYSAVPVADIVTPQTPINTFPEFGLGDGSIPYALMNCEITIDRFGHMVVLDYPDGDLTDMVEIAPNVDLSTPNESEDPADNPNYWELTVTDSDDNTTIQDYVDDTGIPFPILVFEDIDPPTIYLMPFELEETDEGTFITTFPICDTIDVVQGTTFEPIGAEAFDDGDTFGCPATLVVDNAVNTDELGEYTVTYTSFDVNSNEAEPAVRVVNVIAEDTTDPVIEVYDNEGNAAEDGATFTEEFVSGGTWTSPSYFAFDNVDCIITDDVSISGDVDLETIGEYPVTYTVTDNAGNESSFTITVSVADTQAPVVNLSGPATIVWSCGTDFTEPGFSAFDNADGNLTSSVETSVSIDGVEIPAVCTTWEGTYVITYTVTDASGNPGTITRNVIIPSPCTEMECEVGINEGTGIDAEVRVYPIPTQGTLNISLGSLSGDISVNVFDAAGKMVQTIETTSTGSVLNIDLSEFNAGIYFVNVTSNEGTTTKKAILDK